MFDNDQISYNNLLHLFSFENLSNLYSIIHLIIIYDGYARRLDCVGAHVAVVLLMR